MKLQITYFSSLIMKMSFFCTKIQNWEVCNVSFLCRILQDVQDLVLMGSLLPLGVQTIRLSCLRLAISLKYSPLLAINRLNSHCTLQVSKIKQMMGSDAREGPIRPVIRTFYDHAEVLNHMKTWLNETFFLGTCIMLGEYMFVLLPKAQLNHLMLCVGDN